MCARTMEDLSFHLQREQNFATKCTCHRLPLRGFRAEVGEYGDFMATLQQISSFVVGEMLGLCFCLTKKRFGMIFCYAPWMARWQRGRRRNVLKSILFFLSINRPSVKQFYVFVGINNFKIP